MTIWSYPCSPQRLAETVALVAPRSQDDWSDHRLGKLEPDVNLRAWSVGSLWRIRRKAVSKGGISVGPEPGVASKGASLPDRAGFPGTSSLYRRQSVGAQAGRCGSRRRERSGEPHPPTPGVARDRSGWPWGNDPARRASPRPRSRPPRGRRRPQSTDGVEVCRAALANHASERPRRRAARA